MQLSGVTLQSYSDDIITKLCKVEVAYDESAPSEVFIRGVDLSIQHSLRNYWATHSQVFLADITIRAESLPAIQKKAGNPLTKNQQQTRLERPKSCKSLNNCCNVSNVNTEATSPRTCSLRRLSKSPTVMHINQSSARESYHNSTPSSSPTVPSKSFSCCDICYDLTHVTAGGLLLVYHTQFALARPQNTNKSSPIQQPFYSNNRPPSNRNSNFKNRGLRTTLFFDHSTRVSQSKHISALNHKN